MLWLQAQGAIECFMYTSYSSILGNDCTEKYNRKNISRNVTVRYTITVVYMKELTVSYEVNIDVYNYA